MCLSAALLAAPAIGGGSSPIPLRVLTDQSNAVVVAEISGGTIRSDRVEVKLTIVRALTGTLRPGQVLTAESVLGTGAAASTRTPVKKFGLCFLFRSDRQVWTFLPPISGYLLDFGSTFIPLPRKAKSVRLPPGIPATTMDKVIAVVTSRLEQDDPRPSTNIVEDYRKNPSPALKEMFKRLRSDPNPRLRSIALRAEGLAESGDARE
jgi:hypothetical protein